MARTALITGASSGLGMEFARLFARDGYDLVLVARGIDKLDQVAEELRRTQGVFVVTVQADLATPEGRAHLVNVTEKHNVSVDVLVNNAGFGDCADFSVANIDKLDKMVDLNVRALLDLTYYYLDGMLEHHDGRILNVASVASFQPGPGMATYFASKAFVLSLSEALAEELRGTGVTCTALCPGTTNTNFWEVAESGALSLMRQAAMASAADVAAFGYDRLMKGQVVAIPGITNYLMVNAVRFVPRSVVRRITRTLLRKND